MIRYPFDGAHRVSSPYGPRAGGMHYGIDYSMPVGTPLVAVGAGVVTFATLEVGGAGNHLVIALDNPPDPRAPKTGYMHLSSFAVGLGQRVKAGQLVGHSGGAVGAAGSGNSRGPHLHFWIGTNGGTGGIDPQLFFTEEDEMTEEDFKRIEGMIHAGNLVTIDALLKVLLGEGVSINRDRGVLAEWEHHTRDRVDAARDAVLAALND